MNNKIVTLLESYINKEGLMDKAPSIEEVKNKLVEIDESSVDNIEKVLKSIEGWSFNSRATLVISILMLNTYRDFLAMKQIILPVIEELESCGLSSILIKSLQSKNKGDEKGYSEVQ